LDLFTYRAFGLRIDSDTAVPGLEDVRGEVISPAPLSIRLHGRSAVLPPRAPRGMMRFTSDEPREGARPGLVIRELEGGDHFHFRYHDETEFLVRRDGSEVEAWWPDNLTLEDTATYLLGPVIAFVLRLRGLIALHASAVEFDGSAALFLGPPGAGKSTTAAAFSLRGFPVLTDDLAIVTRISSRLHVVPSYPRVRLWDESVRSLMGAPDALPLLTPSWEKRYLPLHATAGGFASDPRPIAALFVLHERENATDAPRVERLATREAFPSVIGNLLDKRAIPGEPPGMDLRFAAELLTEVPAFTLVGHVNPVRLDQLCERVRALVASLSAT
jgi:hypothetical protein